MEKTDQEPIYYYGKKVGYAYNSLNGANREWIRGKLLEGAKNMCQICKKDPSQVGKLEIHRVKRGNQGGKYTLVPLDHPKQNCMVVCKDCHNSLHANEYGTINK